MKFISQNIILILILLFGCFLRIYQLNNNPYGFFCDEASIGYNAYSLLKTGTDEYGTKWPLFFKAFGEYKSPVMTYATIPFVAAFGMNEFSVRLSSAIWGIIGIYAIYILAGVLFNKKIGLLSALFLAVSPWHIHLSRVSLEGLMSYVSFTIFGVSFWVLYIRHRSLRFGVLSTIFLVLAVYSYFPARVFVPILGIVMLLASVKTLFHQKRHFFILAIFTTVLLFPLFHHMITGQGMSRWELVKGKNDLIATIQKYTHYYSYDYLFSKGDIDFPGQFITRHSIRGLGQLYLFQLPLLFFGLIELIMCRPSRLIKVTLFVWLLLYPVPDLFTAQTSPYATRSIIGVVPFQIISALGIMFLLNLFSKPRPKIIIGGFITTMIAVSLIKYFILFQQYPQYSSDYWGWQSGPRQIMNYFINHQSLYQQLCLEGQFNAPEIFLKFYDPENHCLGKCSICDYRVYDPGKKQLFALSRETYDKLGQQLNFLVKEVVYYPDTEPAFYIGAINETISQTKNR
jgi:4-amino-4-deoxy-L-arabinose transferase-like glycosyltransferase